MHSAIKVLNCHLKNKKIIKNGRKFIYKYKHSIVYKYSILPKSFWITKLLSNFMLT